MNKQNHGVTSPEKHDMGGIMNHSYLNDNMKNQPPMYRRQGLGKVTKVLPKVPTKASQLRDLHIKQHLEEISGVKENGEKRQWKMRQFLGVGPSQGKRE